MSVGPPKHKIQLSPAVIVGGVTIAAMVPGSERLPVVGLPINGAKVVGHVGGSAYDGVQAGLTAARGVSGLVLIAAIALAFLRFSGLRNGAASIVKHKRQTQALKGLPAVEPCGVNPNLKSWIVAVEPTTDPKQCHFTVCADTPAKAAAGIAAKAQGWKCTKASEIRRCGRDARCRHYTYAARRVAR